MRNIWTISTLIMLISCENKIIQTPGENDTELDTASEPINDMDGDGIADEEDA